MGEQAKTSPGKPNYSGLDLEKGISTSGRGESFFLTSLFIELIDRVLSAIAPYASDQIGLIFFQLIA
jgi:hypothetical protein